MRLAPKALIALVVVAMLVFAGCGGGGSDTASTTTPTTTTQKVDKGGQKQEPKQKQGGNKGSQNSTPKLAEGSAPTSKAALPNQGTKAVAPGVPTVKHGDNSIQTYGVETSSAGRVQAATLVQAYLNARAAGRWTEACSYFSSQMITRLNAFLTKLKGRGPKGCAGVMKALSAKVPQSVLNKDAKIHVLSMRVQGIQGFIIYKDATGTSSNFPMKLNGGIWKLDAPAGIPLQV